MMLPIAQSEIDVYASHPGNIPNFHNFETPQLEPGDNGVFSLEIQNRYINNITNAKVFEMKKKYKFLDKIFLSVLKKNPEKMPNIFFKMFNGSTKTVIKFLSNKSNIIEDLSIILKMPKWIFIKALFKK